MEKTFLTAMLDGTALYAGDTVYSTFHKQKVKAISIWIDQTDNEVFVNVDLGNGYTGNVRVNKLVNM